MFNFNRKLYYFIFQNSFYLTGFWNKKLTFFNLKREILYANDIKTSTYEKYPLNSLNVKVECDLFCTHFCTVPVIFGSIFIKSYHKIEFIACVYLSMKNDHP